MDINQALGIAKNLKNHFRTFEKIDEFLKEVAAAKVFMEEIESRKAALEEEIVGLQEEKVKMSEAIEAMKPTLEETRKAEQTLNQLKADIADLKAKLG